MALRDNDGPTEAERLTALESSVRLNRLVLLILVAIVSIIAVGNLTVGVMKLVSPSVSYVDAEHFLTLKKQLNKVEEGIPHWQVKIDALRLELDNSQASTFKTLLLEQEQSYQVHLQALKQGMKDIAHMVPGSRTWLDIYNEQMDVALAQTNARMKKLATLQTQSSPPIEANDLPSQLNPMLVPEE